MSAVLLEKKGTTGMSVAARLKREVLVSDEAGWKVIRSPRPDSIGEWHQMLAVNSTMPPRLKYAMAPLTGEIELRAECLAGEAALISSCADFMRGAIRTETNSEDAESLPLDPESWIHLCESAGWKAEARGSSAVVVPLPSGRHIRIDSSERAVRAVVELGEIGTSQTARARELLLLTLAHEVRMVRPLLRGRGAGSHTLAEIETGFRRMPEAEEWSHALASLAVAATACADVFDAFADEDLASQFLAIRQLHTRSPG